MPLYQEIHPGIILKLVPLFLINVMIKSYSCFSLGMAIGSWRFGKNRSVTSDTHTHTHTHPSEQNIERRQPPPLPPGYSQDMNKACTKGLFGETKYRRLGNSEDRGTCVPTACVCPHFLAHSHFHVCGKWPFGDTNVDSMTRNHFNGGI